MSEQKSYPQEEADALRATVYAKSKICNKAYKRMDYFQKNLQKRHDRLDEKMAKARQDFEESVSVRIKAELEFNKLTGRWVI